MLGIGVGDGEARGGVVQRVNFAGGGEAAVDGLPLKIGVAQWGVDEDGARGEGAYLLNTLGERFMKKYAPEQMELATRSTVSLAIGQEILEGLGWKGRIWRIWSTDWFENPEKSIMPIIQELNNLNVSAV